MLPLWTPVDQNTNGNQDQPGPNEIMGNSIQPVARNIHQNEHDPWSTIWLTLVTEEIFNAVQVAMKRNSGRSETLHPSPSGNICLKD